MTIASLTLLKRELVEYKAAMQRAYANFLVWSGGKAWSAELTQIIKGVIAEAEAEIAELERQIYKKAA